MRRALDHLLLCTALVVFCGPVIWLFRQGMGPSSLSGNLPAIENGLAAAGGPSLPRLVWTSVAVAAATALLATVASFCAAFALVFCRTRLRALWTWAIIATLYFPVEARMIPTVDVVAGLGLTSTLTGLVLPILPLALGTLVFRQHFRRLPPELLEAARLDGAGPVRSLVEIVLPLSLVWVGAMGLISFIWGWNQYLWPLMASLDDRHWTMVRALESLNAGSGAGLTLAALALLPPLLLVLLLTRLLKGTS